MKNWEEEIYVYIYTVWYTDIFFCTYYLSFSFSDVTHSPLNWFCNPWIGCDLKFVKYCYTSTCEQDLVSLLWHDGSLAWVEASAPSPVLQRARSGLFWLSPSSQAAEPKSLQEVPTEACAFLNCALGNWDPGSPTQTALNPLQGQVVFLVGRHSLKSRGSLISELVVWIKAGCR